MNDWITIFETNQLYQAEMVKDILGDKNIEAVILNRKDSSFKIGIIEVMVRNENKEKAAEIVKSIDCE